MKPRSIDRRPLALGATAAVLLAVLFLRLAYVQVVLAPGIRERLQPNGGTYARTRPSDHRDGLFDGVRYLARRIQRGIARRVKAVVGGKEVQLVVNRKSS